MAGKLECNENLFLEERIKLGSVWKITKKDYVKISVHLEALPRICSRDKRTETLWIHVIKQFQGEFSLN